MSMSREITECHYCEEEYQFGYDGQYCSEECLLKSKADNALENLRRDHKVCGTCLGVMKEVSAPTEDWEHERGSVTQTAIKHGAEYHNVDDIGLALDATSCYRANPTAVDSVVGYQHRTTEAETVIKEHQGPDEYSRLLQTGTGCKCGSTDHTASIEELRECDPARVLANYIRTFRRLRREGAISEKIDKRTLFETYRETRDFELALGRALYR